MQLQSNAQKVFTYATCVAIGILLILICFADSFADGSAQAWLPQVAVTLAGFVGASWFAGRRLDLLARGVSATERANFNGEVKEAVNMLSNGSLPSVLAGQRWLHQIASVGQEEAESVGQEEAESVGQEEAESVGQEEAESVGQEEAELVQALLCSYIVSSGRSSSSPNDDPLGPEFRIKTRQAALKLLFGKSGKKRYSGCKDEADLGSAQWEGLDFADLDLTKTIFSKGNFTGANVAGACFDESNLRETQWAGPFGGNTRTRMDNVDMRSVFASSCTFHNISFRGAKMGTYGPQSKFIHCKFENCDFEGADWTGAFFDTPEFDEQCIRTHL